MTALVRSAGVTAEAYLPHARDMLDTLSALLDDSARDIDEDRHPGDTATVAMMGATADHIVGVSRDAGLDLELPVAIRSHYDRAIAAGHGRDGWTRLIGLIEGRGAEGVSPAGTVVGADTVAASEPARRDGRMERVAP